MEKNEIELLEEFKNLENQIIDVLKSADVSIDMTEPEKLSKTNLKNYISKVKKAETLFEKYEGIAKKIEALSGDESGENDKIVSAVVDLREDSEEVKQVIENINGQVVVKQKKKKIDGAVKEF